MTEKENVKIDESALALFNNRVDELTDQHHVEEMKTFIDAMQVFNPVFNNLLNEAQFYYMLANAYSVVFVPQHNEWFEPNLNKAIIHFKKALAALNVRNIDDENQRILESQIETNYGNYLSQQGRFMCAKTHWKKSIELNNQPIAHTAIYYSEMYIAQCMKYDKPKSIYHQFLAYQSLCKHLELPNNPVLFSDSYYIFENEATQRFKNWFEEHNNLSDFEVFYTNNEANQTKKESDYLNWCGKHNLFIDELDIDDLAEAVYPDSLSLPSISSHLNMTLAHHEELVYHSNFDEIKNDFCYARYLIFTAINVPKDTIHFFNNTFPKTDDLTYSIDNLKAQHLKSAFKILYALFDKISYFISHFFDLNDIDKDRRISFENLFKKLNNKGDWKPNPKLKNSKNTFLHALFYILKDLRDIKDQESVSDWLNPEIIKICEIRNYIEHRSFKLIDSLYEDLVFSDGVLSMEIERLVKRKKQYTDELQKVDRELKKHKGSNQYNDFVEQKRNLEKCLEHIEKLQLEKQKRVQHTLIMTDKDFTVQLLTLADLVRNSIIYLSFSLEFENYNNPVDDETFRYHRDVPTK